MEKYRILIAGCGDVGSALGVLLARRHCVYGLRRSTDKLPQQLLPISADLSDPGTLQDLPAIDILVYCAAPRRGDSGAYTATYLQGYRNLLAALPQTPVHVFFTSSTSVYAQNEHQWVDEQSATTSSSEKAQIMLAAEHQVLASPCGATVVRFSGIYGPQRLHLLNQVLAGKALLAKPLQYSNRIHRDDCAGVLEHLINTVAKGDCIAPMYLASDCKPTPISEVMDWLARQTRTEVHKLKSVRSIPSKRCDNSLLIACGYQFKYADYRAGYQEIIEQLQLD
ncbi:MAG: SDR family oxidoreductase [Pseudomonadales bacterium]|nr:SDR family oxidoreductase [Pseudomonadales bacterium]NRA15748.1 SDR family oxidoreductase [Oceanospirillaceae bacterium]